MGKREKEDWWSRKYIGFSQGQELEKKATSERKKFLRKQEGLGQKSLICEENPVTRYRCSCKGEVIIENSNPSDRYFCENCEYISPERVFLALKDEKGKEVLRPLFPNMQNTQNKGGD